MCYTMIIMMTVNLYMYSLTVPRTWDNILSPSRGNLKNLSTGKFVQNAQTLELQINPVKFHRHCISDIREVVRTNFKNENYNSDKNHWAEKYREYAQLDLILIIPVMKLHHKFMTISPDKFCDRRIDRSTDRRTDIRRRSDSICRQYSVEATQKWTIILTDFA
jgi:hypothetical protein